MAKLLEGDPPGGDKSSEEAKENASNLTGQALADHWQALKAEKKRGPRPSWIKKDAKLPEPSTHWSG